MTQEEKTEKEAGTKTVRPPIVVVMGHIDHGKTKILDWYRKTKVAEQESGGITQHIGAYEVEHHGKKITFIDTPGHEAFSKMRSRGAKVADIAILVVAADEGVKPQTTEAIDIIRQNNLPFVVALNKIDKPESNPDRVKKQLAEAEAIVESYGGKIPSVEVSAKSGEHMDDLLEMLLLLAEMEHLQADPEADGEGVVVEAHLDPKRGITSTLLVQNGAIRQGDTIAVGKSIETIKILEDFLGHSINEAGPSTPVRVAGLSETPAVGDPFKKFSSKEKAEAYIKQLPEEMEGKSLIFSAPGKELPVFNIIVKADVAGSREVLEESLKKLETGAIGINILKSEVGNINESDIKTALATGIVTLVGFKVKIDASARELAERGGIRIVQGDVIYQVLDELKRHIEDLIPPTVARTDLGKIKILKVFKTDRAKQIVGGRVEDGTIRAETLFEIKRMKDAIGFGIISELQKGKVKAIEAEKGSECGISIESKMEIKEGDLLEVYKEEITKQKL